MKPHPILLLLLTATLHAQTFQAATLKPSHEGAEPEVAFALGPGNAFAPTGGRFYAHNLPLVDLIAFAWKLNLAQKTLFQASAPHWLADQPFDLDARAEDPQATKDQMRLMVQSLLIERFALTVRTEQRAQPVLALVLARPGRPGRGLVAKDCSPAPTNLTCGVLAITGIPDAPSRMRLLGYAVTLAQLATQLGQIGQYDRPLVDRTNLLGTFDITMDWGPDPDATPANANPQDDRQADLQQALRDQLGLKLERQSATLPVLLFTSIHRQPASN